MSRQKRKLILAIAALALVSLDFLGSVDKVVADSNRKNAPTAIAQQPAIPTSAARDAGKLVYKKLPNFPQENKYVSRETGKVNSDNTLVDRLIRYHLYVKGRAPNYRLDWKLTLADYLGANELIQEKIYPGADALQQNPREGDRAAIAHLNRKQRDALVQTLVSIFATNSSAPATTNTKTRNSPSTTPSSETQPNFPQPKPGDAQLLQPWLSWQFTPWAQLKPIDLWLLTNDNYSMERVIKSGAGWRVGWNPNPAEFKGLVGGDDWAIELTEAELDDFCRLSAQLVETMSQQKSELMDEEKIACEAESDLIWLEVEGYPHAYSLRLILNTGRCAEVSWKEAAVPGLVQAAQMLTVF